MFTPLSNELYIAKHDRKQRMLKLKCPLCNHSLARALFWSTTKTYKCKNCNEMLRVNETRSRVVLYIIALVILVAVVYLLVTASVHLALGFLGLAIFIVLFASLILRIDAVGRC